MMLENVLLKCAYLFSIFIYALITGRNMIKALMCLELALNVPNVRFYCFDGKRFQ